MAAIDLTETPNNLEHEQIRMQTFSDRLMH